MRQVFASLTIRCVCCFQACDEWFELTGSRGIIFINGCSGKIYGDSSPVRIFDSTGWTDVSETELYQIYGGGVDWGDSFIESSRNFVEMCHGVEQPCLHDLDGLRILQFSLGMQRSSSIQSVVQLTR